ncbi:Phenylacetate-coenzyme A ligase [Stieleria bergensis]|uniref:Phenylacetate-coenzyme A ligase n=2 Tax=Stieleria bergensis TaxID=2528025 RepID=A0A517SXM7_9BACT|nr:Phenylacetate-coenzyme A ligase [Planctomycetes bacterium SV_7m_r]
MRAGCWSAGGRFVALARWPDDPLAVGQQRLAELLQHARDNVPFYADRIPAVDRRQSADPASVLEQIPVTTKDDVEAHFPDQITDGSDPADWRLMSTRGTAQRLITIHGFAKRDAVRAANLRMLCDSGRYRPGLPSVEIPPEVCETVCGDLGETQTGVVSHVMGMLRQRQWRDTQPFRDLRGLIETHWVFHRQTYPGFGLHGSHPDPDTLNQYVARLRTDRPYLVKALATYLTTLARHLQRNDLPPLNIPVIKTMGSRVTPGQRSLIESSFGGKYWDDYGSAEFGTIANECVEHAGLHVYSDWFHVEVVDDAGNPVPDGKVGHVLITDLVNHTMPLIRYKIGDLGRIDRSPCPCGNKTPRLTVHGRAQDIVTLSQGRIQTTDDVLDFLEALPGVDSAQLVDCGDHSYQVSVVPAPNRPLSLDETKQAIVNWLSNPQDSSPPAVDVQTVATIRPESGGKFRYVK